MKDKIDKIPEIGDVLTGNSIVLQSKRSKFQGFAIVLCLCEGRFVTWLYNIAEGYRTSGDYDIETLDEALEHYNRR